MTDRRSGIERGLLVGYSMAIIEAEEGYVTIAMPYVIAMSFGRVTECEYLGLQNYVLPMTARGGD